ncbi:hypothetical protein A6A04_06470 [Paramagnetospirillum marisnigri]|uniref:Cupin fold metalloprotein WbuC cupin domain-containing protein n=1 Tax=Paramagnetospirillum marisnigri TaxID=1285242 RepID=A0A178MF70_9PROT|nr:WbuC family cupin fold metalloprotein [Paramagnetospirillum marisnigri]OAN46787.1 hypothetical protein A6A04_06470 [Paramagnetospirillum marisnigri]
MKILSSDRLAALVAAAGSAPRRRAHLNIHDDTNEPINRLLIALEPDTYIRPHRHPGKFEMFVLLEGTASLLSFDDQGRVAERIEAGATGPRIVEFPAGSWHTVVAGKSGALMLEVKAGPYAPTPESDFAAWAPPEGSEQSAACRDWLRFQARPGGAWIVQGKGQ